MLGHRLGNFALPPTAYTQANRSTETLSSLQMQDGRRYFNPAAVDAASGKTLTPRQFAKTPEFGDFKTEYHELIDTVAGHLIEKHEPSQAFKKQLLEKRPAAHPMSKPELTHAQVLEEALLEFNKLEKNKQPVPDWLSALATLHDAKRRLFDFNDSGTNPHYPTDDELALAYNGTKKELEKFERLLQKPQFTAENKSQCAIEVGIASGKCAAGLEEEAQQQQTILKSSSASLPHKIATIRDRMALQHLENFAASLDLYEGNLRHGAVALYNGVRWELGLGELVGEEGNWSTSLNGFDGDPETNLNNALDSLTLFLTATAVVSQVAVEGFQSLRTILAGLPSAKDKLDEPLDEMDMYAITKELSANKEYKQLKEGYGKDFELPVSLMFRQDADDNYHFTSNPLKFELHLMQFMKENHLGVETSPVAVMSRQYKDEMGMPVRQTLARWDDLHFIAENRVFKKGEETPEFNFEQADYELLDAAALKNFSFTDLTDRTLSGHGRYRNQIVIDPDKLVMARSSLAQAIKNSTPHDLLALGNDWFYFVNIKKSEDKGWFDQLLHKIDEQSEGSGRIEDVNSLLSQMDRASTIKVNSHVKLQALLSKSAPTDFILERASQDKEAVYQPLLLGNRNPLSPQTLLDLLNKVEQFPAGAEGMDLVSALQKGCSNYYDYSEITNASLQVKNYLLSSMSRADILALPQKTMAQLSRLEVGQVLANLMSSMDTKLPGKERLDELNRMINTVDRSSAVALNSLIELQSHLIQCTPEDFISESSKSGYHPLLMKRNPTLAPATLLALLKKTDEFPQGNKGLALISALQQGCDEYSEYPAINDASLELKAILLGNMSADEILQLPHSTTNDFNRSENAMAIELTLDKLMGENQGDISLGDIEKTLSKFSNHSTKKLQTIEKLQTLLQAKSPADFIDDKSTTGYARMLRGAHYPFSRETLLTLLEKTDKFPPGQAGMGLSKALRQGCYDAESHASITSAANALNDHLLENMPPAEVLRMADQYLLNFPLAQLAKSAEKLPAEQRPNWLAELSTRRSDMAYYRYPVDQLIHETAPFLPPAARQGYAAMMLNKFDANNEERLTAAIEHNMPDMLMDILVTQRAREMKKNQGKLSYAFSKLKDPQRQLAHAFREYRNDENYRSLVHIAAMKGNGELVRKYATKELAAGKDYYDCTPLYAAIRAKQAGAISALVNLNPEVLNGAATLHSNNFVDISHLTSREIRATPISWAVLNQDYASMAELLKLGARIEAPQAKPKPSEIVMKLKDTEALKVLMKDKTPGQRTTFLEAMLTNSDNLSGEQTRMLKMMVEIGATVTPAALQQAERKRDKNTLQALIPLATPDVLNGWHEDENLLFNAVSRYDSETVQLLLEHGADMNIRSANGRTPYEAAPSSIRHILDEFRNQQESAN
ncbi:hypothetical protein ACKC9G_01410 [Pokkaliibacter sp. CJK22405]|uniref:hypothetical protein n=1 Tax=Pokkaliibacter sp. CJK22405 TaxID=3384615 RepID=UPI0039846B1C